MNGPSLKGLHVPLTKDVLDEKSRMYKEQRAFYQRKYGDNWRQRWLEDCGVPVDYDGDMKFINTSIYYGICASRSSTNSDTIRLFDEKQTARWHELYGDCYDELLRHKAGDPRVVELLLQDALRTGKWKELPDELQDEYRRRAGNLNE